MQLINAANLDLARQAAPYVAGVLVTYWLVEAAYRLLLHPLKDYPGPFLAKISDVYGGYHAIRRHTHLTWSRNHDRYGPVIRAGPNRLIFNSSQALQDIYNNNRVVKSDVYLVTAGVAGPPHIFNVIDRKQHRAKRRVIGEAVSEKSMRIFEPTMQEQIDVYLKLLLESTRGPKPSVMHMADRFRNLGVDIVAMLSFGAKLNTQTDPKNRILGRVGSYYNHRFNSAMQWGLLHSWIPSIAFHLSIIWLQIKSFKVVQGMIKNRLAEPKNARHDLYSVFPEDPNVDEKTRQQELWSEAMFFFPAGADTSSTGLSALFFYLSRNLECYEKLVDEIRGTFTSGEQIRGGPQLTSCTYLRACIDETLRMSPPVGGSTWRELPPDDNEPFIVDGHVIPKGTLVGVSYYALHHNEEYFRDPYTFNPERWLEADEDEKKVMNEAFAPFSVGYRSCGGKPMAYLEMSLVTARTLWYFDFEKARGMVGWLGQGTPGDKNGRHRLQEYQLYDTFASTQDGPNLVFRPRGEYWKELV